VDLRNHDVRLQNMFEDSLNDDRVDARISQGNLMSVRDKLRELARVEIEAHDRERWLVVEATELVSVLAAPDDQHAVARLKRVNESADIRAHLLEIRG
jgi:hypothetical protein